MIKKPFSLLLLFTISASVQAQDTILPAEIQVKLALLAAPAEKKDSSTVYGYASNNEFVLLRKGTNELVCLADDPSRPGLSVACYHKSLEPFMNRGRELKKEGKSNKEIFDLREKEVKDRKLSMPSSPATLFVYSAEDKNYDKVKGEVKDGYLRYVVYIPYATPESTGLPLKPAGPAMPWIMHPGTHGAHIMINP